MRRLAVRQAADDPQAIHVGHDLVEGAQLAQVIGLGDGRGDGAANAGGRRGQGCDSSWGCVARGCINHDLYQSALMLCARVGRCQHAPVVVTRDVDCRDRATDPSPDCAIVV